MTDPLVNRRKLLHAILVEILGSRNVYFQPPDNLTMQYPALVYNRDYSRILPADNVPYMWMKRYQITHINGNPDSPINDKLESLPYCSFIRHFETDELHHNIFNLYY